MNGGTGALAILLVLPLLWPTSATATSTVAAADTICGNPDNRDSSPEAMRLPLSQCISLALENSSRPDVAAADIEIAESRKKQAQSSYWPSLTADAMGTYMDEDPNFLFPSSTFTFPGAEFSIPANAFGPGFPPLDVIIPVAEQEIEVPEQDVKLMDRANILATLGFNLPLFTGGLRPAMVKQAEFGVQVARHDAAHTDDAVVFDVTRVYYGAVLLRRILNIGEDTVARMEATLSLTERLYKEGSGAVKKTDYLKNKTFVEGMKTLVSGIQSKERTSRAALAMLLELEADANVIPVLEDIPYDVSSIDVASAIAKAYEHNPELAKVDAALGAADAGIKAARSGYFPMVQLSMNLAKIENSYDMGLVTPKNATSWSLGIGARLPIFNGFRTKNEVREARALRSKLGYQRELLRRSITLDIESCVIGILQAREQELSSREAYEAAVENRDLNVRAYQADLVETQDVIEAQMTEAIMEWQYQKVLYDHAVEKARLEFLIGDISR